MFHGQGKEKSCPLNSVVKTNELLCQGYIMYWCYASNIQPHEEKKKANDIPIACEFRDVFLKSYWDSFAKRN